MTKIDVTPVLKDFNGEPLMHQKRSIAGIALCPECTMMIRRAMIPLTLRLALTNALTAPTPRNRALDSKEKFDQGEFARRIYDEDTLSLQSEEITLLKDAVGAAYDPLEVFLIHSLLDPKDSDIA